MTLFKTFSYTLVTNFIKISSSLIINKVSAVYLGPSGLAIVAQLQNFILMAANFSSLGLSTGITKYIAETRGEIVKQKEYIQNIFTLNVIGISLVSLVIFFLKDEITIYLFNDAQFLNIIYFIMFSLIFSTFNIMFLSIINGKKEIKKLNLAQIFISMATMMISTILIINFNLIGALIGFLLIQIVSFIIIILFIKNDSWLNVDLIKIKLDKIITSKLSAFILMAFASNLMSHGVMIILRNHIVDTTSWLEAGYWQAIIGISANYLMVISLTMKQYYVPTISSIQSFSELKKEMNNGFKLLMPFVIITSIFIFIFKEMIIRLLFTDEFLIVSDLIWPFLLANVIKVLSLFYITVFIAKSKVNIFIYSEFIFGSLFLLMAFFGMEHYGIIGIGYAQLINYILYLIYCYYFFYKYIPSELHE
jgi:polysaccharide transporter, PST family